jgi:hypothetical protein
VAGSDFPLSINRRRLLTSAAAAVTATGSILPGVKRADAAASDLSQSSPPKVKPEPRLGVFWGLNVETNFAAKQACRCFRQRWNCTA